MSASSEAKNLEAVARAIDRHDRNCDYPAVAVLMNPYEVDRLGWDSIKGVPIRGDERISTGRFEVLCAGDETAGEQEEEAVEAVAKESVPMVTPPV